MSSPTICASSWGISSIDNPVPTPISNATPEILDGNKIIGNNFLGVALLKTFNNKIQQNIISGNADYGLLGGPCLDDARYNYWGDKRPDLFFNMPFNNGDVVLFIAGWVKIWPWLSKPVEDGIYQMYHCN